MYFIPLWRALIAGFKLTAYFWVLLHQVAKSTNFLITRRGTILVFSHSCVVVHPFSRAVASHF